MATASSFGTGWSSTASRTAAGKPSLRQNRPSLRRSSILISRGSAQEGCMILVAGATGLVGREICRLLLEKKKPVRAIVRKSSNQELVNDLKSRGAEIVVADFKDHASLSAACRNVQSVVY